MSKGSITFKRLAPRSVTATILSTPFTALLTTTTSTSVCHNPPETSCLYQRKQSLKLSCLSSPQDWIAQATDQVNSTHSTRLHFAILLSHDGTPSIFEYLDGDKAHVCASPGDIHSSPTSSSFISFIPRLPRLTAEYFSICLSGNHSSCFHVSHSPTASTY